MILRLCRTFKTDLTLSSFPSPPSLPLGPSRSVASAPPLPPSTIGLTALAACLRLHPIADFPLSLSLCLSVRAQPTFFLPSALLSVCCRSINQRLPIQSIRHYTTHSTASSRRPLLHSTRLRSGHYQRPLRHPSLSPTFSLQPKLDPRFLLPIVGIRSLVNNSSLFLPSASLDSSSPK